MEQASIAKYERICRKLRLGPDDEVLEIGSGWRVGAMLLQAITVRDQDYRESTRNVDYIKRYIFPGGQLVSIGAICEALTRGSDLRITHLEDITPHYAETLARWRARMLENLDGMRGLGLPERFLAMWEFYLCYCEGGAASA